MKIRHLFKYTFLLLSIGVVIGYIEIQKSPLVNKLKENAPVISFDENTIQVSVNSTENELLKGAKATDAEDGDLSDTIEIESISSFVSNNISRVTYVVFDQDGNVGKASRYIEYTDYEPPVFSMSGDLIASKYSNSTVLSSVHASSSLDGDLDSKITVMNADFISNSVINIKLSVTDSTNTTSYLSLNYHIETDDLDITLSDYMISVPVGTQIDYRQYIVDVTSGRASLGLNNLVEVEVPDMSEPGLYEVVYTVNYDGMTGKSILLVNVSNSASVESEVTINE